MLAIFFLVRSGVGDTEHPFSNSAVPYWKISHQLTSISFKMHHTESNSPPENWEIKESLLIDTTKPALTLGDNLTRDLSLREQWHLANGYRTIIAAAREGQLRRLALCKRTWMVLMVRAWLPYWVRIDDWGVVAGELSSWTRAALALRPVLSHVSRWQERTADNLWSQRHVTSQLLRSLHSRCISHTEDSHDASGTQITATEVIERFLPWLAEDAELAQQVAQVWNDIVDRGEADKVRCMCDMCSTRVVPL